MSNNKQSSVEWLIEQMLKQAYFDGNKPLTYTNLDHVQEQAKAMHKEEIEDAFGVGCQVESTRLIEYHEMAEQYYNETYETNNKN